MNMVQEFQKKKKKKKKYNKKIEEKNRVLESPRELTDVRDNIIDLFREGIFPFKGNVFKTIESESEENKLEKNKR